MRLRSLLAIALLSSTTAACADASLDGSDLDLASEESALEAAPDVLPPAVEYFLAERDARLCQFPMCGGYFVSAPNRPTIECPDGTVQAKCHIGAIDLAPLGLDAVTEQHLRLGIDAGKTVIRGRLVHEPELTVGSPGTLVATEGWLAADDHAIRGTFFRLQDTGQVCVTEPCFHYLFAPLNLSGVRRASQLSWPGSSPESTKQLHDEGVLATGIVLYPPGGGGIVRPGINLVVSHHFLRVDHQGIGPVGGPVTTN
jgi:hypothetical protein